MGVFSSAGWMWSPLLVNWGSPGKNGKGEIPGIFNKKKDGGKGRPLEEQRQRQIVDVWNFTGIYCLYNASALIYVGQATKLGERLAAHWRDDHLVGRWDSFSWASFTPVEWAKDGNNNDIVQAGTSPDPVNVTLDELVHEMEAFAIFAGQPVENRQDPDFGGHTKWLDQVRAKNSPRTDRELLEEILTKLPTK